MRRQDRVKAAIQELHDRGAGCVETRRRETLPTAGPGSRIQEPPYEGRRYYWCRVPGFDSDLWITYKRATRVFHWAWDDELRIAYDVDSMPEGLLVVVRGLLKKKEVEDGDDGGCQSEESAV